MKHQFYTKAPIIGPVYTLQYFNVENAREDKTVYTDKVMTTIQTITKGESFYYQFDNPDNTSHCVVAHFSEDTLIITTDERRTTLPGSFLLTEVVPA